MNPYLKKTLLAAAAFALVVPAAAMAQKSIGGATGEARLHPGTWNQGMARARSRSMYRTTPRAIVRSERAPVAVAEAPTERRNFSYEPSQQSDEHVASPCDSSNSTAVAPESSSRSNGTVRSYSYEPSEQTYSAPRMRSQSRKPAYQLQKTDPNKYRGL